MSYKVDLSRPTDDSTSISAVLAERFAHAIDEATLAPGEQLPTIRELAELAGVNQLTAARIYKRLGEHGYVTATVGRGTFVRNVPPFASDELADDWQAMALRRASAAPRERLLQEAMNLARGGEVITLGAGLPATEALPLAELRAATEATLKEDGAEAFAYTDVEGLPELRAEIAGQCGYATGADEVVVTSGARQAIDLVARTVLSAEDVVCVEVPTFVGTLGSLDNTGAHVIGIPSDADGLDVSALEAVLTRHPVKLVALQSACHNPTGRHLAPERRRRLVELARERSFFVLEDRVYANLDFAAPSPPPLRLDAPAHVVTVDSLSKTIGGGLRIGWLAARGPIFSRLVSLKLATDLNSSAFAQRVAARYLASGAHPGVIAAQNAFYRERRDALLASLNARLEGEFDALEPLGGHNLWLTLRRRVDERLLYAEALRRGVSFTPGHAVQVESGSRASMRLSFSLADPETLDEGVKRLSNALRATLRTGRIAAAPPA